MMMSNSLAQRRFFALVLLVPVALLSADGWGAEGALSREASIEVLRSDAALELKYEACRRLAVFGDKEAVPELAALLADPQMAHMARYALEAIPGPEAGQALIDALDAVSGKFLAGVINSLGTRQEAAAAPALASRLRDASPEVARAAALALSRIATPTTTKTLLDTHGAGEAVAADALLGLAERLRAQGQHEAAARIYTHIYEADWPKHVRLGAFSGLLALEPERTGARARAAILSGDVIQGAMAIQWLAEHDAREILAGLAEELEAIPVDTQILLIHAISRAGLSSARPTILSALNHGDSGVRAAAIHAAGLMGFSEATPALLNFLSDAETEEEALAASQSLCYMPDGGVNGAITAWMQNLANPQAHVRAMEVLTARTATEQTEALFAEAAIPDSTIRVAAFRALGALAGQEHLHRLLTLISAQQEEALRTQAERMVVSVIRRSGTEQAASILRALDATESSVEQCSLLRILGGVGQPGGFKRVCKAVNSSDAAVSDTALRVLAGWPDPEMLSMMVDILPEVKGRVHQVLLLRGILRLMNSGELEDASATAICKRLLAAVREPDDKKLVLKRLEAHVKAPRVNKRWVKLFNGKDLDGWNTTGEAEFKVVDGSLLGTQTTGKGGDLWHDKMWSDFEMRVEYRVEWPANTGFWFRVKPESPDGYQYDVLKHPKPVAYSGSLYCRGKLFISINLDEELEHRDDWNEAYLRAQGNELSLWLNGQLVAYCHDDTFSSGRIGVQVHGGEQFKGMRILVRSMDIKKL